MSDDQGRDAGPHLEARGLGRQAPGQRWLVRDATLTIGRGRRMALVGRTGSGKTVLLRLLSLLDRRDAGQLLWHGSSLTSDQVPHYRRQAVHVSQRPAMLSGSVEHNLHHPYTLKSSRDTPFDRDATVGVLERLGGAADMLTQEARELSGGEQQQVALARALQLGPLVLLLDEPTAAMDRDSTKQAEQAVLQWQADDPQRSFLWVSHDEPQVARVADVLLRMDQGRLQAANHGP